jgi:hypothetical protein
MLVQHFTSLLVLNGLACAQEGCLLPVVPMDEQCDPARGLLHWRRLSACCWTVVKACILTSSLD